MPYGADKTMTMKTQNWKTVAKILAVAGVFIGVVGNGLPEGIALKIFLNLGLACTSASAFIANMNNEQKEETKA